MGRCKIITIVGNVAAGKTSAAPLIVDALGADYLDADTLFITENPFKEQYLRDVPRWAFANELWLTRRRAELLREAKSKMNGRPLVIDSGLLMSWVYAYSHYVVGNFSKHEWELYDSLYGQLTDGLMDGMSVVMLQYSIETLMKRLKQRGRDYELEFYTEKYLMQLEEGLLELKSMLLGQDVRVVSVNEEEVGDFLAFNSDRSKLLSIVNGGL